MYGKWTFRVVAWGLVLAGMVVSRSQAAPPWPVNLVSFNQIESDPDKAYTITESNGPYMIMACSFSGEGAEKQAQELVLELRKRYKLPAYVYKKRFELTEAQGRGLDKFGEPVRMRYHAGDKIDEVAVLVGDYPSVEDSEAQKILKKIKYAQPKCLDVKGRDATNQSLAGWRSIQHELYEKIGSTKKEKGPMSHAMIATNPLLPPEYFAPKGLDPFIAEMNKDLEFSLLKCPGKFTVQVATFKGQVLIKPDEIEAVQNGKRKITDGLVEAANKATMLAKALRMKGFEAYEFHDRNASIVTVGSFNSMGTAMPDGRIELDPKIALIIDKFKAQPIQQHLGDANTMNTAVQSLVGINFDIQPIPVQVPKTSISASLNRRPAEQTKIDFRE